MALKKVLAIDAGEFRVGPEFIGGFIEPFAEKRDLVSKKLAIGRCADQTVTYNGKAGTSPALWLIEIVPQLSTRRV